MVERTIGQRQAGLAAYRSAGRPRVWRVLMWTHRWLGLIGGIVVVLMGLTGSFLVFYRETDAALNPALYAPAGPAQSVTLTDVMRAAAVADPAPISTIVAPDRPWPVWVVIHSHESEKGRSPSLWTTMVDPSNGRV